MSDVVDGEQLKLDLGPDIQPAEAYDDKELFALFEKDPRLSQTFDQIMGAADRATSLLLYCLYANRGFIKLTPTVLAMDKAGDHLEVKKLQDGGFGLNLVNKDGMYVFSAISGKLNGAPVEPPTIDVTPKGVA